MELIKTYITKDNAIRAGLIGVGLVLLVIAGTNLPTHHARSWFGGGEKPSQITRPVEKSSPAVKKTVKKRVPVKKVAPQKKVTPPAPQEPVEQPHGWTRVCGNDQWCNWVWYP